MSKIVVDLTNFKDRMGQRVAPGRHRVQVEDVEQRKARTGNQMIEVWFRVMGGKDDGATIIDRFVLSDNALFRVVGFMQALGIPTPKKRLSVDINKWVGRTLDIDVDDGEPYNGTVRSEVKGYLKVAKAETAADDDELDFDTEDDSEDGSDDSDDVSEDADTDSEEEKPKKAKKAKKAEPETDSGDGDDGDDFDLDDLEV